jgi:hypothetical protein
LTTGPTSAFYIEVTAAARQVDCLMAPVLANRTGGDGLGPTSGRVSAVAVAGINQMVCDFPPLMICNPAEVISVGAPFSSIDGTPFQFKAKGGSGQWEPGNFGLLDSPTAGQGTPAVMENIATSSPAGCFNTTVDLRTGAASNPIAKAFNVRFDMYENPGFGGRSKNQSKYKPAPNVIDAATASSATGENGNAMNYGGAEPPDVKRRLMNVAVINCIADGPMNGNTDNVPVVAFAKLFRSHAAEDGSDQTIYAEMVGTLQPGVDDELHDIVQLFR